MVRYVDVEGKPIIKDVIKNQVCLKLLEQGILIRGMSMSVIMTGEYYFIPRMCDSSERLRNIGIQELLYRTIIAFNKFTSDDFSICHFFKSYLVLQSIHLNGYISIGFVNATVHNFPSDKDMPMLLVFYLDENNNKQISFVDPNRIKNLNYNEIDADNYSDEIVKKVWDDSTISIVDYAHKCIDGNITISNIIF